MNSRQRISAAVLIAVTALTLTACAPGGIEGEGVELVESSLRGETAYDMAADLGTECEVTGSHVEEFNNGETGDVPVVMVDLDCEGAVEEAQVWMNAGGGAVDTVNW